MYETLFINLDTMNKQDYKRSQQQRLTIMEELKQQMMKQAVRQNNIKSVHTFS